MEESKQFIVTTLRLPAEMHKQAATRLIQSGGKFQGLFIALLRRWLEGDTPLVVERPVRTKPEPPPLPPEFRALKSILEGRNSTAKRAVSALLRALEPAAFQEQYGTTESHSDEKAEYTRDLARGIEAAEAVLTEEAGIDEAGTASGGKDSAAVGGGSKRGARPVPGAGPRRTR